VSVSSTSSEMKNIVAILAEERGQGTETKVTKERETERERVRDRETEREVSRIRRGVTFAIPKGTPVAGEGALLSQKTRYFTIVSSPDKQARWRAVLPTLSRQERSTEWSSMSQRQHSKLLPSTAQCRDELPF
jgi:hypothetical protein